MGQQMENTVERMLSAADVAKMTSLHRGTIWRKVRDKEFPAPVQISSNRIAFRESEVAEWIDSKPRVQYRAAGKEAGDRKFATA